MGVRLTRRREQVLAFVRDYVNKNGSPPTIREIAAGLGIPSHTAVVGHLEALERAGLITRTPHRSRGIRPLASQRGIPVLGRIAAGKPIYAEENIEGEIVPDPFLVRAPDETFVLKVEGDSMTGDAILPGDYIFVRRQPAADPGQIVVALIDSEATVKRYYPESGAIRLVPSNPLHAPIVLRPEDGRRFEILGVVTGVFRRL